MERMTVKEASEALGLSKNTIMYRLSKLPPEMFIKEDGKIYIFEDGFRELSKGAKPSREPKEENHAQVNHDELLEALKAQIEYLQNQISIKDEQIRQLNESLSIEQRIHAQFIGKLESSETGSEAEPRKGLFARIFHR